MSDRASYKITQYLTDGTHTTRIVSGEPDYKLLQKLVGGYIELWSSAEQEGEDDVYVDEEGGCKGLPVNPFDPAVVGTIVRVQKL